MKTQKSVTLKSLARKVTNTYIKMAHTSTLLSLLLTFNYHYSATKERTREELITLLKQERNQVLWFQKIAA